MFPCICLFEGREYGTGADVVEGYRASGGGGRRTTDDRFLYLLSLHFSKTGPGPGQCSIASGCLPLFANSVSQTSWATRGNLPSSPKLPEHRRGELVSEIDAGEPRL